MWKSYNYNGQTTNYQVSSNGEVFSNISNKLLKPFKNPGGYLYIHLHINGKVVKKSIHSITAETFIPNPEHKPQINHIDGNKENNNVSNLEWITQKDNNIHALKLGLRKAPSGEKVHFAKYTSKQIHQVCKEIERDELDLDEIEKLSGVPVKTIGEIRNQKIWKDISKYYNFPKSPSIKSKIGLSKKERKQIKQLVYDGKSNKEIYKITGITRTKKISRMMVAIRIAMKNEFNIMNKDQRPSKTECECDEILLHSWEM